MKIEARSKEQHMVAAAKKSTVGVTVVYNGGAAESAHIDHNKYTSAREAFAERELTVALRAFCNYTQWLQYYTDRDILEVDTAALWRDMEWYARNDVECLPADA